MHISKRSNGIYYIWFTDEQGRRQKISTRSSSKSEALKIFRNFIQSSQDKPQRQPFPPSLSSFTATYLDYAKGRYSRSYCENIAVSLRGLLKTVGDLPLQKVGVREVEQFLASIAPGKSDRTSRAYFVTLASAFQTAMRWGHIETNPFRRVVRPRLRELLPVHLTKEELRAIVDHERDQDLRDLYICAVSTGMRLGEMAALQWEDVDFVQRVIRVQNTASFTTKNRKNRTIPMNSLLCSMLSKRKSYAQSELVFSFQGRRLTKDIASRNFKQCVIAAHVNPALHFHSMRHSFGTWLVQAGVSIYEVQRLLGHSSIAMTQVYAHLAPSELHETVEKILPVITLPEPRRPHGKGELSLTQL